jgi:hypothetical protein
MLKFKSISVLLLLLLFFVLIGCQNYNFNLNKNVTNIEVYDWETKELITTISDKEFIEELVNKLNNTNTGSTANMDFRSPDYKLLFKNDEETVYEIGYYNQVMNLSVKGRYWDFNGDVMYGVELPLPPK